MFGTSGIRGPVGTDVTAPLALSVGRALGIDADRVVVGRDPRASGGFLADALAAGCREAGTDVVDLGPAATPTVARAVGWEDADAGAAITASHNPPADNGIKLWQPSGQAFDADLRERIAERVREDAADPAPWDAAGRRTRVEEGDPGADRVAERHVDALVEAATGPDSPLTAGETTGAAAGGSDGSGDHEHGSDADADRPRVAVDLGNGAGGVTVAALRELGFAVETLNAQPDGSFPGRPSEPTAENCRSLQSLVAESDARLGIAHDGDADRLRAATADGTFVSGDDLLAVFAAAAAEAGDAVAVPVDTSLAVADHLAERDVDVTYTPVGDVYVAAAASESGVAFGGEPSGAWIWPAETLCPDGPLAACKLAALDAARPLADRIAEVPEYPIRRDSVSVDDKEAVMERVRARVADAFEDVRTLDGVRVDLGDAWFLVRASGTQPLVRITAEARDDERAGEAFERARSLVADARDD